MKPFPKDVWVKYHLIYREGPDKEEQWERLGRFVSDERLSAAVSERKAELAERNSWHAGYRGIRLQLYDQPPRTVLEGLLLEAQRVEAATHAHVVFLLELLQQSSEENADGKQEAETAPEEVVAPHPAGSR